MSRIGKKEINIPEGVEVTIKEVQTSAGKQQEVTVKGKNGELVRIFRKEVQIAVADKQVKLTIKGTSKLEKSLWGLSRTLVDNMIIGVTTGYKKELKLVGVGFRATLKGANLDLQVGKSHPVIIEPPESVKFNVTKEGLIEITGPNKELVGQVAADVRSERPPEPYKGKGIFVDGEKIRRKAGKSGAKA